MPIPQDAAAYPLLCRYRARRASLAATIGVTDGLVHSGLPTVGHAAGGRAQRGLMMELFTRRAMRWRSVPSGWVPRLE